MKKAGFLVIIGVFLIAAYGYASDPEGCMECHGLDLISTQKETGKKLIFLEYDNLKISKHGEMYCSDCHTDASRVPHQSTPDLVSCQERCHIQGGGEEERKIHTEKYYSYQDDVHFSHRYGCKICHTEYSSLNRVNASMMCIRCHKEENSGEGSLLFSTPVHGDLIGPGASVLCIDCHSAHPTSQVGEEETMNPSNCYRGAECHDRKIFRKIYLAEHTRRESGNALMTGIQVFFQMVCVLFVLLGAAIVYRSK